MSIILDCSSFEKTLESVGNILKVSHESIVDLFFNLDTDYIHDECPGYFSFEKAIFPYLENRFEISTIYNYVYWFHGTRKFKNQNYNTGLLPLELSIDLIWIELEKIALKAISKNNWVDFKQKMITDQYSHHMSNMYLMRTKEKSQQGPVGLLIKEIFFDANGIGNWDYLGASEIVYDICAALSKEYKFNMLELYRENSDPCIIKFRRVDNRKILLGVALSYLYCKINKQNIWHDSSFAFNGQGNVISDDDIVDVHILDNIT